MKIYERVFDILREKGMSQKDFALKTGIPQSTISDWKGRKVNPNADKIMVICKVLGVTPYDILSGAESEKYTDTEFLMINKSSEEYLLIEKIRSLSVDNYNRLIGYLDALTMNDNK